MGNGSLATRAHDCLVNDRGPWDIRAGGQPVITPPPPVLVLHGRRQWRDVGFLVLLELTTSQIGLGCQ